MGPYEVRKGELCCGRCRYLRQDKVQGGFNPIHEYYCEHDAVMHQGELFVNDSGRFVGNGTATPKWCPVGFGECNSPTSKM